MERSSERAEASGGSGFRRSISVTSLLHAFFLTKQLCPLDGKPKWTTPSPGGNQCFQLFTDRCVCKIFKMQELRCK